MARTSLNSLYGTLSKPKSRIPPLVIWQIFSRCFLQVRVVRIVQRIGFRSLQLCLDGLYLILKFDSWWRRCGAIIHYTFLYNDLCHLYFASWSPGVCSLYTQKWFTWFQLAFGSAIEPSLWNILYSFGNRVLPMPTLKKVAWCKAKALSDLFSVKQGGQACDLPFTNSQAT